MKNQSLARNISRWVIAFVSALFLFALLVLGILRMTLFNQEFMIDATHKSDYTTTITNEINENIQDLGRGSNIPADVLENVVDQEIVQSNLDSFIRGMYTYIPFQLHETEKIHDAIEERVVNYASEMDYELDETAIERLATDATDNFAQYIEIPYIKTFGGNVMAYKSTLNTMTTFCTVFFLLSIAGTFGLTRRWWHHRLRFAAYIIGGAALMLIVLPGIAYLSGTVYRLSIGTESLYLFLTTYVNMFILTFVKWGFIALVAAILMWLVSELMRRKVVRSQRKRSKRKRKKGKNGRKRKRRRPQV